MDSSATMVQDQIMVLPLILILLCKMERFIEFKVHLEKLLRLFSKMKCFPKILIVVSLLSLWLKEDNKFGLGMEVVQMT